MANHGQFMTNSGHMMVEYSFHGENSWRKWSMADPGGSESRTKSGHGEKQAVDMTE